MLTEPCPQCSTLLLLDDDLIQCASCGALMKVLTFDPPTPLSDSRALELISEASPGGAADMRRPLPGRNVRSRKASRNRARHDDKFINRGAKPGVRWPMWPLLKTTVYTGGLGIFVMFLAALDMLFHITIPFLTAVIVFQLPAFIFSLTGEPNFHPYGIVRPAHWFAAVWYLVFAALSILLMIPLIAHPAFEVVYFILAGFILLGARSCLVVLHKL